MPPSNFQPIRLLDPDCCYKFTYLMANSADPDQLASSANWSGSTLFAKAGYIRVQQDKGFCVHYVLFIVCIIVKFGGSCLAIRLPCWGRGCWMLWICWFVIYVLSIVICLLFFLVSLEGYVLRLWLFLDTFFTIFLLEKKTWRYNLFLLF